jgi:hypothetical protein
VKNIYNKNPRQFDLAGVFVIEIFVFEFERGVVSSCEIRSYNHSRRTLPEGFF